MGGFISAQRRIQGIKGHGESLVGLIELSTLSNPLSNLWAPVSGAIFAVVIYAMFTGGLLSGSLFPKIQTAPGIPGVFKQLFSRGCGPADGTNAAILVVWCFIAGFAERLVPDALSRVVATSYADHKKEKTRGHY
jgi:hypothetical protein